MAYVRDNRAIIKTRLLDLSPALHWVALRRAANDALLAAIAIRPELTALVLDGIEDQPHDDEIAAVALAEVAAAGAGSRGEPSEP